MHENKNEHNTGTKTIKKIGKVTYEVVVHFNENATETMQDKLKRIMLREMDSQIFLDGTEQTTLKDLNAILGRETIDMHNTGQSKGSKESHSLNYRKLGKDLMTMDELAVMDGAKCIVQVRGIRPFLSDK